MRAPARTRGGSTRPGRPTRRTTPPCSGCWPSLCCWVRPRSPVFRRSRWTCGPPTSCAGPGSIPTASGPAPAHRGFCPRRCPLSARAPHSGSARCSTRSSPPARPTTGRPARARTSWARTTSSRSTSSSPPGTPGPELMISTKRMDSSFGNNAANRVEESYGDAEEPAQPPPTGRARVRLQPQLHRVHPREPPRRRLDRRPARQARTRGRRLRRRRAHRPRPRCAGSGRPHRDRRRGRRAAARRGGRRARPRGPGTSPRPASQRAGPSPRRPSRDRAAPRRRPARAAAGSLLRRHGQPGTRQLPDQLSRGSPPHGAPARSP